MATRECFSKEHGEPVWEIAWLFPVQGEWTAEEYLALDTNHFVEFSDGYIEFLSMPTVAHQLILLFLYRKLWAFVIARRLGEVILSPLPVELWPGKFREPDVMFVAAAKAPLRRLPISALSIWSWKSSAPKTRRTITRRSVLSMHKRASLNIGL